MAIEIDNEAARTMAPRFDEALELVLNEFTGLDAARQYHNAFARLLTPDPLDRVLMMGTDQRDLFVPVLRTTIASSVPTGGHVLDFGADSIAATSYSSATSRVQTTARGLHPGQSPSRSLPHSWELPSRKARSAVSTTPSRTTFPRCAEPPMTA